MRRVLIDDPAMLDAMLARPVIAPSGEVLGSTGLRITPRMQRALQAHGVAACFIDDAVSEGVTIVPAVDASGADQPLVQALATVVEMAARPYWQTRQQSTSQALESILAGRTMQAVGRSEAMQALVANTEALARRLPAGIPASGLVTDRHPADDVVGHGAAVAAIAIHIARAVGFSEDDTVATGIAGALHDIGLALVPEEVRRTPVAARTAAQRRRYEDHALLGEALLRPLGLRWPAMPLVALQHHEEQSGRGYPHGLTGGNRLLRGTDTGSARIALVAEVVAVADRYERLVSGGTGEPPLSAAAARHALAAQAGARLNAEVVGRLLDMTRRWPAGTEVVLHGGRFEGARAIVIVPDPANRDQPRVRVFRAPPGPASMYELDLAEAPDISLSAVDEAAA